MEKKCSYCKKEFIDTGEYGSRWCSYECLDADRTLRFKVENKLSTKPAEPVRGRTYCWFCGTEMIWGGDNSFEDFDIEGEGIVANLSCPNCEATAEFTTKQEEE